METIPEEPTSEEAMSDTIDLSVCSPMPWTASGSAVDSGSVHKDGGVRVCKTHTSTFAPPILEAVANAKFIALASRVHHAMETLGLYAIPNKAGRWYPLQQILSGEHQIMPLDFYSENADIFRGPKDGFDPNTDGYATAFMAIDAAAKWLKEREVANK